MTETAYRSLNDKAERLAQAMLDRLTQLITAKEACATEHFRPQKGARLTREATKSPIDADPRPPEGKNKPLQRDGHAGVFVAFSARAGKEFGFMKGAKSRLFLAMWSAYNELYHGNLVTMKRKS